MTFLGAGMVAAPPPPQEAAPTPPWDLGSPDAARSADGPRGIERSGDKEALQSSVEAGAEAAALLDEFRAEARELIGARLDEKSQELLQFVEEKVRQMDDSNSQITDKLEEEVRRCHEKANRLQEERGQMLEMIQHIQEHLETAEAAALASSRRLTPPLPMPLAALEALKPPASGGGAFGTPEAAALAGLDGPWSAMLGAPPPPLPGCPSPSLVTDTPGAPTPRTPPLKHHVDPPLEPPPGFDTFPSGGGVDVLLGGMGSPFGCGGGAPGLPPPLTPPPMGSPASQGAPPPLPGTPPEKASAQSVATATALSEYLRLSPSLPPGGGAPLPAAPLSRSVPLAAAKAAPPAALPRASSPASASATMAPMAAAPPPPPGRAAGGVATPPGTPRLSEMVPAGAAAPVPSWALGSPDVRGCQAPVRGKFHPFDDDDEELGAECQDRLTVLKASPKPFGTPTRRHSTPRAAIACGRGTPPTTPKMTLSARPSHPHHGSLTPMKSPMVPPPSPYVICESGGCLFGFTLRVAHGVELGLELEPCEMPASASASAGAGSAGDASGDAKESALRVTAVHEDGAVGAWNRQCVSGKGAGKEVREGDKIVAVNQISEAESMLQECKEKRLLKFLVVRGEPDCPFPIGWGAPKAETSQQHHHQQPPHLGALDRIGLQQAMDAPPPPICTADMFAAMAAMAGPLGPLLPPPPLGGASSGERFGLPPPLPSLGAASSGSSTGDAAVKARPPSDVSEASKAVLAAASG